MSMFSLLIGNSGWPPELMDAWGISSPEMIGRYRDHWCEHDGDDALVLAVYTRNGGGNRPDYATELDSMHALDSFVSDADDDFDETYCTLRFRLTKSDFFEWMQRMEDVSPPSDDRPSHDDVWQDLWDAAEPNPRNMASIWRAMIQQLEGQV